VAPLLVLGLSAVTVTSLDRVRRMLRRDQHPAVMHLVGSKESIAALADDIENGVPVVVTFRRPSGRVRAVGDTWQLSLDVRTAIKTAA